MMAMPALIALIAALGCSRAAPTSTSLSTQDAAPKAERDAAIDAGSDAAALFRPQLDGRAFPDGVLALTWDDGPDAHTLELAKYLNAQKIAATFFVVREWIAGESDDPGLEPRGSQSGYAHLPVLADLVALGHRVGNHTLRHTLLTRISAQPTKVLDALALNQRNLDPFQTHALHLFRVPGGAWDEASSAVVESDSYLQQLTGPVRWDVDRKDWDNSLRCDSLDPKTECEKGPIEHVSRTKPAVIARRYLASIDDAKHGIVLLHDRVGDVGSRYALDLAKVLVPALEARGYVFAAPVLAFSPLKPRTDATLAPLVAPVPSPPVDAVAIAALANAGPADLVVRGDVNGDGRADGCGRVADAVWCALAKPGASGFARASRWTSAADEPIVHAAKSLYFLDLDRDGRMDICTNDSVCGFAP